MNPAISQVQDAASALLKLREGLILSFAFSEPECTFVLVCEFPEKAPGSSRAFARCRFNGVREFVREPGDLKRLGPFNSSFSSRTRSGGPQVIESIKLIGDVSGGEIDLWFGWNFGGVRFKYDSVVVHTRDTKAVKHGDEWDYFDFVSGDPIDFYEPFA
jgi:hypothetical protein